MKVHLIKEYIEKYKTFLDSEIPYYEAYKWECVSNFQEHWNLGAEDLRTMYKQSLSSIYSAKLWKGSKNSPKSVMLKYFKSNPEFARDAFRDLFNEELEVILRMDRFSYHCDQLLPELIKFDRKADRHYHDDFRILSVYLALKYPQKYCVFDYKPFKKMMVKLETQDVPAEFEIGRFFKLMQGLYKILIKDKELLEIHAKKIEGEEFYKEPCMMLVHDFYWCCNQDEYGIDKL